GLASSLCPPPSQSADRADAPPDHAGEARSRLGTRRKDLLVRQGLTAVAGAGVRDEGHAADLQAGPAGSDTLQNGRHADGVGAQPTEHPDLRWGLVLRPEQAGVDALGQV